MTPTHSEAAIRFFVEQARNSLDKKTAWTRGGMGDHAVRESRSLINIARGRLGEAELFARQIYFDDIAGHEPSGE